MTKTEKFIHPYIPNYLPDIQRQMLDEIGVDSIEDLYVDIPMNCAFGRHWLFPLQF